MTELKDPKEPFCLKLLGPFAASVSGAPLPPLRTRKDAWLLGLLVLNHPRPLDRAWLASTLWPDSPQAKPLSNLRKSLKSLRGGLGSEADRLVSPTPRTLALELEGADVDLLAFDAAMARHDPASLARAVRLYRGPLLEGCSEAWVIQERRVREEAYLQALRELAEQAVAKGQPALAEQYLRQAIAVDALRESAHRALMRLLAGDGNTPAALLVYHELRQRLRDEVNAEPDAETTALFQELRTPSGSAADGFSAPRGRGGLRAYSLPAPLTPLLGREREAAELQAVVRQTGVRLITLTGPGGAGKTRLGLEVASGVRNAFADGVFFVPLAPVRGPELMISAIAQALSLRQSGGRSPWQLVTDYLRERQVLLLLDNFEQLLPAAAPLLADLLSEAPRLKLLVTSRAVLHVRGEREFPVPPLAVPELKRLPAIEALSQYAAVELFIQRSLDVKPDFAVTNGNAPAVAEICHRLDGLPLAIELAAARTRILPPQALLSRLGSRLKLLTGGARDLPVRQQTLRATIDWSYDLLSEGDKRLFRRLSVFVGGCTLEAAEAVCAGEEDLERDILAGVEALITQSLLRQEGPGAEPRFVMLETIREYASERLRESSEAEALRRQHAQFFLRLAQEVSSMVRGPEARVGLDRLEKEHDNLWAAVDWFIEVQEAEAGFQLGVILARFWSSRGYLTEARERLAALLALPQAGDTSARAEALTRAGSIAYLQGDYAQAEPLIQQGLTIARAMGDSSGICAALHYLADVAVARNDNGAARAYHQEKVEIARAAGDWSGVAGSLIGLGGAAYREGDLDTAQSFYEESLALCRRNDGSSFGLTNPLNCLGCVARDRGDYAAARELFEQALAIGREIDNKIIITTSLYNLGTVAQREGNWVQAQAQYEECLAIHREMGSKPGIDRCLSQLDQLTHSQNEPA
jgi:predicted ATPase/DNA-binding SARP family transcriptional activator